MCRPLPPPPAPEVDNSQQKLAVFGALSLYLNFINLFQMLLSLVGQRND